VSDSWLSEVALALNCRVGAFPFVYLALSVSGFTAIYLHLPQIYLARYCMGSLEGKKQQDFQL